MNIGIVTTWFERGAAYVSRQFEDILAKDHNVYIYARGGESYAKDNANWDKINVTWGKKINIPFIGAIIDKREFLWWIKHYNIEIIIFNEQRWWYPIIWCNELGIKTIAYIDYYTERTLPLYKAYDILICNTKKHYGAFDWYKGARYVPWGTDVSLYAPKEIKEDIDVVEDTVFFFHSCGMNPKRKGTDLLLKCLDKLEKSNFQLIIHTQISITKTFPELKEVIDRHINVGKLKIIEKTVPVPGLYHMGDVYVYPSRLDGIGLTVPEAIASGLCVIVPDCGPMNEFVTGKFGIKIKVDRYFSRSDGYYWPQNEVSEEELALALDHFIQNKNKLSLWKQTAREYALEYLDWRKNSTPLNHIVKELSNSEYIRISAKTISMIKQYETSGIRKYSNKFINYFWIYKLYKYFIR